MALYIPKLKLIFLHIYKTAGTTLRKALMDIDRNYKEIGYGHADYSEIYPEIEDNKVFSVVRNPYNWIYSLYQYAKTYNSHPFHIYCATHNFEQFVFWYFKNIEILSRSGVNGKLQTQTEYLSINGEIKVDYILKMENLEVEFNHLLSIYRETSISIGRFNCTPYEIIDFSTLKKETIDIINEKYHQDFINFNYTKL